MQSTQVFDCAQILKIPLTVVKRDMAHAVHCTLGHAEFESPPCAHTLEAFPAGLLSMAGVLCESWHVEHSRLSVLCEVHIQLAGAR